VFTDEFIIDELMDFFFAATGTTLLASTTIVGHFATTPASLQRVRDEFRQMCTESDDWVATDASTLSQMEFLKKYVTLTNCQDLTYLDWVTSETLRFMNPAPNGSSACLTQDTTIGKYLIKAGDAFQVNINGLHYNSKEWQ